MPFYTYHCSVCEKEYEVLRPISDFIEKPEHFCPNCLVPMKPMIGIPIIKFVGGGWSKDGYNKTTSKEDNKQ
jgi:putative FmdB family regulatory protein